MDSPARRDCEWPKTAKLTGRESESALSNFQLDAFSFERF